MKSKPITDTPARILDVAERLVQVQGFNAFSYADIAEAVGIRKASLHHHFPTKAQLGIALVSRYHRTFSAALDSIESDTNDALERLKRYVELYAAVLRRKRMCLCGMLATDVATLPKGMRDGLARYFSMNELWLKRVLEHGAKRGTLRFDGTANVMASFFLSSLEGGMLVARGSDDPACFTRVARRLLECVTPEAPKRATRPR